MSAQILDGRPVAEKIRAHLQPQIEEFRRAHGIAPTLALVRVGDAPDAVRYTHAVDRAFTQCGMGFQLDVLPSESTTESIAARLDELARARHVHGILLQHPLPPTVDARIVMTKFPVDKDVEGISPANLGNLGLDTGEYFPTSMPRAAIELLAHYEIPIAGKHAVVVSGSDILGKPLALMLLRADATVTVCDTRTRRLADLTRQADLLIVGVQQPKCITVEMVAPGAVVIDFGVSVREDRLVGDVDFDSVKETAAAISPVPGGTGPVKTMVLMRNTVHAAQRQAEQDHGRIQWLPPRRGKKTR